MNLADYPWEALRGFMVLDPGLDEEETLHEIAHVLDATGPERTFEGDVGPGMVVNDRILQRFKTTRALTAHEIRATAITILTLRTLAPDQDFYHRCFDSMWCNLVGSKKERLKVQLDSYLKSQKTKRQAEQMVAFIRGFRPSTVSFSQECRHTAAG